MDGSAGARRVRSAQPESAYDRGNGPKPHRDGQAAGRDGDGECDRAFDPGASLRPSGPPAIIPERIARTPKSSEH
jgi:hypothetical protein